MQAKLSQLATYLGERMDKTTDRKAYMAYAIARHRVLELVYEILDKQLSDSLSQDDGDEECV